MCGCVGVMHGDVVFEKVQEVCLSTANTYVPKGCTTGMGAMSVHTQNTISYLHYVHRYMYDAKPDTYMYRTIRYPNRYKLGGISEEQD